MSEGLKISDLKENRVYYHEYKAYHQTPYTGLFRVKSVDVKKKIVHCHGNYFGVVGSGKKEFVVNQRTGCNDNCRLATNSEVIEFKKMESKYLEKKEEVWF